MSYGEQGSGFQNQLVQFFEAGNTIIINPQGLFVYSGTPALGNLIASIAPSAGTDRFGNTYGQGIAAYGPTATGVMQVTVQAWGPSGGSSGNRTTDSTGGSSGGGGEFASQVLAVTPGHTYNGNVGAGGSAGIAGGAAGGTGTSTTFTGDSATVTAHSGTGGTEAPAAGGVGGTGSTNTIHFNGGNGAAGSGVNGSAGGGSSAGTGAPGNPGAVNAGGIAPAGGGNGANGFATGDHTGLPGAAPGGGPSGPLASTINFNGAAGTAGQVVLTWAGGSQTFSAAGPFTWTAPVGVPEEIILNAVTGALSEFFYTGAPSDAPPGAHFFSKAFSPGQVSESIELAIIGPTSTGSIDRVDIQQLSSPANFPAAATGFLIYNDTAGGFHQVADWGQHGFAALICSGIVGQQPGTIDTTLAAETWHTIAPVAGFSAGTPAPRYRFEPIGGGQVRLTGEINLTGNQAAGTTFFTMPAGYHPANQQFFKCVNDLTGVVAGGPDVTVDTAGDLQLGVAGNAGTVIRLDGIVYVLD